MQRLIALALFLFFAATPIPVLAVVNINTADLAELGTIKGVGPKKAQAIIDYRNQSGGFKSVDDLVNIKGIGPKTLEKLRPQVTAGEGAGAPPATAAKTPANESGTPPAKTNSESKSPAKSQEKPTSIYKAGAPQREKPRIVIEGWGQNKFFDEKGEPIKE